jgi:hypothetical protein
VNIVRGFVAVIVGLAITLVFVQLLESTLANAMALSPPQSLDEYAVILNTPAMMVIRVVFTALVSVLGGYVCAKIAAHDELRYTAIAATVRAAMLVWAAMTGRGPATPSWLFVALLAVSTVAMLAGGAVRAAAASIQGEHS